jgi:hypothetical protein
MIAEATNYYTAVSQLPEDTEVIFHGATWDEYEELLNRVGEAAGLRISFNDGTLKVISLLRTRKIRSLHRGSDCRYQAQTPHQNRLFRLSHNEES